MVMNTINRGIHVSTELLYSLHGSSCNDTTDSVVLFENTFHILHVRIFFIIVFTALSIECVIGEYIVCAMMS